MSKLYRQGDRRGTAYLGAYRLLCAALAFIQILLPALAAALPTDGHVAGGHATIQQTNPKALTIQQATDKAILNWKSFSIAADEAVRFIQPSTSSIALNRVIGVDPSVILGQLQSNGRIFLINPNGILFGAGAQINVGGLLATTLQIRNGDFMAGRFLFAQDPTKTLGTVINQGTIHVSDHGFVFLVAPGVVNEGLIVANLGTTVLGSSQRLTLDLMGDGLINYAVSGKVLDQVKGPDGKPLSSAVSNSGTIQANGGQVVLSARASADVFSSVVNQSGVIRAQSLVNHGGVVRLEGSDPVANTGTVGWQANLGKVQNADGKVLNTGTIDVSAAEPGAAQGQVTITGEMVGVAGTILARGAEGAQGGRVFISSTEKTVAASDSVIDTSGVGNSSAGNVVLWSDKNTIYGGTILARGGAFGGNGGSIEVSGHENLGFFGQVNALAPKGATGTLLLDPLTITVATGGAATLAQVDQFSDTPAAAQTIAPATINAAAANVTLQANNDITVTNAIAMTNNGVGITMQAGRDILVNAGVSTTNGNISLKANDSTATSANRTGGTTGDIVFGAAGNLSAGTGSITLTIDPSAAAPFSPGSITTVRNLSTTTGNISINSPNTVSLSGAVNAGSGTVTINANTDGAGAQAFTMNAGSSITTTNTTAGAVQINVNAAGGGTGTAALDNITVPAAGTLTVATNTGGNLTGGAITQNVGTSLNVGTAQLSTGNGAITFNNAGNDFGTVAVSRATNVTLTDSNALILGASTVSGTLNATTAGALTQSGPLTVTGVTTLAAGAANNITLNNAANNFSTVGITSGNNVNLRDANALILGASTVSGTLNVTTNGALTQSGALNVTGTTTLAAGAANNITLNNAANNFSTVGVTSGNNVALTDSNALDLAASTVSGTLNITAGGLLSQSGPLTVAGNASFDTTAAATLGSVNLTNGSVLTLNTSTVGGNLTVTTTTGDVTLPAGQTLTVVGDATLTPAGNVNLLGTTRIGGTQASVGGAGSNFVLGADTNLNALPLPGTGNITVNTTGTTATFAGAPLLPSAITLNSAGNNFGGTVSVTTAAPAFTGTVTNTHNLMQSAAVTLNPGQGLTVTDLGGTVGTRGNITLPNAGNSFNTVTFTGGDIAWQQANAVTIGSVSANAGATSTGALTITANGPITQTGAMVAAGTTTLAAGAANNITLNNVGNNFSTVGITSGNNVSLTDANALDLGSSTINGALNVNTSGALTQSGALTVTGVTTLAAGAANNITLNNAGNNFSTVGIASGNNVAVTDATALDLAFSTVSGNLSVVTNGAITQSGAVIVPGTTTLAAGAGNNITLNNAGNNFNTVGITSGNNVAVTDVNALDLGTSTVSGTLNVTTAGALTQSGPVTVAGTTTLAAGAANNILLNNAGNDFSTVAVTTGNNVSLTDANALNLAASTVSGTLTVASNGALTQSGALSVTGITTLAAGASNNITLNNAANNFSMVGVTSGNNVTLTDANALDLGASTVSGTLNVTTNGALTQSGALNVTGTTTLAAGAGNNITLTNAANDFSIVGIISGNNVALTDSNALDLGASTVSGTLTVNTGGAVTQSGPLTVTGATTLAAGAANNITLNNAGNDFSSVGITSGNNVALVDANALTLNASTASGNVSVNANDLTVGDAVNSTGGSLNLSGANTVTQLANLTVNGANNVTVTTTTGSITMAPAATTTSGAGAINYTAGTDVILGSLVTGGAVNVTANGGSVLSAAGSGTNVTAGLNSTIQALGGVTSVTGTILAPITVNVIGGTLGVAVAGAVAETIGAVSGAFTGTVSPSNTLTLLNSPPGFVLFNSTVLNPLPIPSNSLLGVALLSGFSGYLNPEVYIPAFYLAPSGAVTINDITPLYIPQTMLAESPVSLNGDERAVARGIPPCFPESGCRPGASVLIVPADAESLELPAAK